MNETAIGNKTNIGTTDEIKRNQRTYVTIQDNKHRLKDLCTDSSFKTSSNGDEEVSKQSRRSQSLLVNIPAVTGNHRDCDVTKNVQNKQVKYKACYYKALYLVQYTTFVCNKKTFYPLFSEFTLPLDWEKF